MRTWILLIVFIASANILDAFILSKELKGASSGKSGSDVIFRIERRIEHKWNLKS